MSTEGAGMGHPGGERVSDRGGIDDLLRSLDEGIRNAVAGFSDAFEGAVAGPLRGTLSEIAEAHAQALAEAALPGEQEGEAASSDSDNLSDTVIWRRGSSYRNAVLKDCLEPLQGILLSRNTGQGLEGAWRGPGLLSKAIWDG